MKYAALISLFIGSLGNAAEDPVLWSVVKPQASPEKNCAQIQLALDAKGPTSKSVALAPASVYRISCTIRITDKRTLLVPSDSELVYVAQGAATGALTPQAAIEIDGAGQLLGNGVLRVDSKEILQTARPRTGVLLSGSEGIVHFGQILGFEYGVYFFGNDKGSAYNDVRIRSIKNALHAIKLDAQGTGWANQNYIHVSRIWTNQFGITDQWKQTYGIYLDSHNRHIPNANRFSGSIETVQYGVHLTGAFNRLEGLRLELGGIDSRSKKPIEGIKLEVDHTSYFHAACIRPGSGCAPTSDNWWFGEYGTVKPETDIVYAKKFLEKTPQLTAKAVQGYGVAGMEPLEIQELKAEVKNLKELIGKSQVK